MEAAVVDTTSSTMAKAMGATEATNTWVAKVTGNTTRTRVATSNTTVAMEAMGVMEATVVGAEVVAEATTSNTITKGMEAMEATKAVVETTQEEGTMEVVVVAVAAVAMEVIEEAVGAEVEISTTLPTSLTIKLSLALQSTSSPTTSRSRARTTTRESSTPTLWISSMGRTSKILPKCHLQLTW